MSRRAVKIATRGSDLARWQAEHVARLLRKTDPELDVDLLVVKTKGDRILDVPLSKVGGKGLFVKEIEQALIDGRADLAVHSMKDVPAELGPGLEMVAITERDDPRDALCTRDGGDLDSIPRGGLVGSSSLRRQCLVKARRPDVKVDTLRGNVPTRLGKLDAGDFDAILLAVCGLERLGFQERISARLDPKVCLPAVGQGALGVEVRADDRDMVEVCRRAAHHKGDARRVMAERAFLHEIEGSCSAPLAAYAVYEGEEIVLDALIGRPDGTDLLETRRRGAPSEAETIGRQAAQDLLERGAGKILRELEEAGHA